MPSPEVLTAAILKVAAGTPELAASLTPDAFLTEVSIAASALSCSSLSQSCAVVSCFARHPLQLRCIRTGSY